MILGDHAFSSVNFMRGEGNVSDLSRLTFNFSLEINFQLLTNTVSIHFIRYRVSNVKEGFKNFCN